MAITTKNRKQLKSYFVKNAIPTEGNFADLVDAGLNQAEDGVFKLAGEPLSVVAAPGEQKRVLRFYTNYPAPNPDWLISLSPAQNPAEPATVRPGFGVTDGAGNTRLYIDPSTGNLGVGTNNPADKLTVTGGDVRIEGGRYRRLKVVSDSYWAGIEIVARNQGESGNPHIDFTSGDLDNPNYGIRLLTIDNKIFQVESQFGPPTLYVKAGHITYDGVLNKLDTAEQGAAVIRAADLVFGHTGRRGKPARALVDNTDALVLNFAKDWPRAEIHSPLFIDGTLGIGTRTPAGPLEVRVAGTGGWDKFIVTADTAWGNGNAHVTIGGGGAAGLMFFNPHVSWQKAPENRASIRYGQSGGVPGGGYWDVGARLNNAFSASLNNNDHRLWLSGDGKVGINCSDPANALDVRIPGAAGGWDRLVVGSTNLWGDGNTQYVTLGAHGATGIMFHNPHVVWQANEKRASIRFGRSGGVQGGAFWDVGTRENNQFMFLCYGSSNSALTLTDGKVTVPGLLEVQGAATLGVATNVENYNVPLRSGFYERDNPTGRVPDNAHPWVHMIQVRHSNAGNNHALQIASSYAQNDRLFFRKIARDLTPTDAAWNELATVTNNVLKIGDWTIGVEGTGLVFRRGGQAVARFSSDWDRFHVYRNINGIPPYFYVNAGGNFGMHNG